MNTFRVAARVTGYKTTDRTTQAFVRCHVCDFNRRNIAAANADAIRSGTWSETHRSYASAYPGYHAGGAYRMTLEYVAANGV